MIVGDLVAMLRLDGVDAFNRGISNAGQNLSGLSTRASASVRAIDGVLSVVGNTINATATLVAGIGTSAIVAGAGFNNLQQNANVALRTLMGSTEAAEAQMAKLNDFASTSPFGRDTLIQAQQQMIGFGIEAENVIPYLGAVQDAVAGIGGSNQDVTEIVSIISRIRSGATLGQEDLNQLADRGINAAALIAQATGQTEQEVRNSIFGNPLRGEDALAGLDAMMSGMQTRFDGAAAGLKKNLDGARDRVKAAMRDIGAVISAPVIDPTGGGWGVTLTNTYADILRGVQTAITPMVDELATRLAPGVMNVNANLQALASTIRQIDMADLRSGFAGIEPYLPVIAGGLAAVTTQGAKAIPVFGGLLGGISPLVAGFAAAAASSPEVRDGLAAIVSAAEPLVPVIGDVATILAGTLASGLGIVGNLLEASAPLVALFAAGVEAIPTPMLAAAAAIVAGSVALKALTTAAGGDGVGGILGGFASATQAASGPVTTLTGQVKGMTDTMKRAYDAGLSPSSAALAGVATGAQAASGAIGRVGGALKTAFLTNPVGMIILGVSTAITAISMASADAEAKTAEWNSQMESLRGTLDQTSAAITEQTEAQIVQNFQAGEWSDRVSELNGGMWSLADMTMAVTGESSALTEELTALVDAQTNWAVSTTDASGKLTDYAGILSDAGISHAEMIEGMARGGDALDAIQEKYLAAGGDVESFDRMVSNLGSSMQGINMDALAAIYDESAKLDTARTVLEQYNDSMRVLREEGGEAAVQQERLGTAIESASNVANDATERLRALNEVLDILNGGTRTAAEQQQELDDAIRDLGDAFDGAKDDAGAFNDALIDANGNIDTSTEQGSKFRDSLAAISDEMKLAGIAAATHAEAVGEDPYTAALDAMKPYADELGALADEYGLTDDQVQGLMESLGMMPEEAAFVLTADGLDDTESGLATIAALLLGLEEGERQIFVQADTDEAREAIEELGISVTETSDGRWRIDLSADPVEAQEQVDALLAYIAESNPEATVDADTEPATTSVTDWQAATDATVAVSTADADAAEARGEVLAWKLEADGTWTVSHMDAEKANADGKIVTWARDANGTYTISHMGAEARDAYNKLNGFDSTANNTWSTVKVDADTSAANSKIDILGGRTVTIIVDAVRRYRDENANGGMHAYANGGIAEAALGFQAFADGGTPHRSLPNGIYPGGRPIYKFAEPETGWEAFVSGKRGMERRNLAILADAQDRLMRQLGLANVKAFANGATVGGSTPASGPLGGSSAVFYAPLVHVENAVLDSPDRVDELANKLWRAADQAARSQGRIDLGGPVS